MTLPVIPIPIPIPIRCHEVPEPEAPPEPLALVLWGLLIFVIASGLGALIAWVSIKWFYDMFEPDEG